MINAKEISGFWIFHQKILNSLNSVGYPIPDTNTNQPTNQSQLVPTPLISQARKIRSCFTHSLFKKSKTMFLCSCKKKLYSSVWVMWVWQEQTRGSMTSAIEALWSKTLLHQSLHPLLSSDRIRYDISNDFRMSTFFCWIISIFFGRLFPRQFG